MRLDKYLVEEGFFPSRQKAIDAIKTGQVYSDGKVVTKASESEYGVITIGEDILKYVSRAGLKLEKAISHFNIELNGKTVLDVGASTGGFTEVSLLNNAKLVYAVDVGINQLHESLINDKRVISLEKTNILDFDFTLSKFDIALVDVSFVSVKKILPTLFKEKINEYVILIKPQFETGGLHLIKGVVKDNSVRQDVVDDILSFVKDYNFSKVKITSSPIKGKNGNKEFIMYINR